MTSGHGSTWQIVPSVFLDMVTDPDPAKAARVTAVMLATKKFDIDALRRAYNAD